LNDTVRQETLKRIPMNAFGQPDDIAEAALFLAGPGGRYITGQVLTVDGGMSM
jgi:3-oxoacyl-[acyl-carrier protein] reductase